MSDLKEYLEENNIKYDLIENFNHNFHGECHGLGVSFKDQQIVIDYFEENSIDYDLEDRGINDEYILIIF